ncbi:trimethyllysine dioxygenase, mitochondrial [Patella vulgata]|uniref:trimethyllysine dioxygenase, mitochondrial n=1 Tax=Patella vulgata TaxID=6465 RepID=UPI00217FEA87|nr:trimethyllysine dioxygenase, mitochondrial [Patella vulgata]
MGSTTCSRLFLNRRGFYSIARRQSQTFNCQISRQLNTVSRPWSNRNLRGNSWSLRNQVSLCRYISTENQVKSDLQIKTDYLEFKSNNLQLSWLWLRDHCRCEVCYNHVTNQKNFLVDPSGSQSSSVTPENVELESDGQELKITWKDNHITRYDIPWLKENSFSTESKQRIKQFFWTGEKMRSEDRPVVDYEDHMKTEEGLKQSLYYLLKYGFTIVQGAPVTIKDTGKVSERVANIMETFFGRVWSFTADFERADTAYSYVGLGCHTDTSYLTCPAGMQVFHCIEHDGEGGQTLLVDGFQAAHKLRQDHEEDFNYLTRAIVPHEFLDKKTKDHYRSLGPVLSVSPTSRELTHIRFKMNNFAPLSTIPQNEMKQFYTAYNRLRTNLVNPANEFWLKLKPGMVLFVDNWRVLHGRSSFTGKRVVCGCYINRNDLNNAYRRHGML